GRGAGATVSTSSGGTGVTVDIGSPSGGAALVIQRVCRRGGTVDCAAAPFYSSAPTSTRSQSSASSAGALQCASTSWWNQVRALTKASRDRKSTRLNSSHVSL